MVGGMVAHNMSFFGHAFDQLRIALDVAAHQKKGGGNLVGLQNVQDLSGTTIFVTGVKGQI